MLMKPVLDVCCGSKMFWFDKNDDRVVFVDKRSGEYMVKNPGMKTGEYAVRISPDYVADFTNLPFEDDSFFQVVFDPPHFYRKGQSDWIAKTYGTLPDNWEDELRRGFAECFRVLKPGGTLIFKWHEGDIKVARILALTPEKPLFGHKSGKRQRTHWIVFMKELE